MTTTYLLCFAHNPIHHAKHYIGKTNYLAYRLKRHSAGTSGVPLLRALIKRGGSFRCARLWEGDLEMQLKSRKEAPRLCPLCSGDHAWHLALSKPEAEAIAQLKQRLGRA
ncbi:MAG: GIY-YIG nuclease family protein [Leptolyngbya sp. SIO4C5]|nr:GIY-YIG nuclease family protein [Leptolyngbya sp. SIO4C5]